MSFPMNAELRRLLRERFEPRMLLAIVIAAAAILAFVELAGYVTDGRSDTIDRAILLGLRDVADPARTLGPPWLAEFARDITALGGPGVLSLIVAATVAFFVLARRPRAALFLIAAICSGALASRLLKNFFARPRPDLVPYGDHIYTATSFPSGHAMMSAIVYLTLGALIARIVADPLLRLYVMTIAALLAGLIGVSRVYLGVHWPSDVLAGWIAGAIWAIGWWSIAQFFDLKLGNRR